MSISCRFVDGSPVTPTDAEIIARAFGFTSARALEETIAKRERTNRERGIVSAAAAQVAGSRRAAALSGRTDSTPASPIPSMSSEAYAAGMARLAQDRAAARARTKAKQRKARLAVVARKRGEAGAA
ncbi:hypothetical protein [Nocardia sp. NPDC046763]|uniref:hypothetical protein n=1 Tax=Nocardia sp. NPDC046763 TaxID=3155256 RepID=UPI0034048D5C